MEMATVMPVTMMMMETASMMSSKTAMATESGIQTRPVQFSEIQMATACPMVLNGVV